MAVGRGFDAFVFPGEVIGDVHAVASQFENRKDVGFEGIADHEELGGIDCLLAEDAGVVLGLFVRDDFDVLEIR